jgi:hypothetical protein
MKHRTAKNRKLLEQEHLLFREIWEERPHHCRECGMYLKEPLLSQFSHYISKGAEPRLRLAKENIDLLCEGHHFQWEFGDRRKMNIYDEERIINLKRKAYESKD